MPSTSLSLILLGLFIAATASLSFVYAELDTVLVNGESFDIHYEYTGIDVLGFSTDPALPSLIISINAPSDGTLDIVLERVFLDSVSNGEDADFLILADTDEATFNETATPWQRILTIDVPAGTEEIGIYGSVLGRTDTSTSDSSMDSGVGQTENTQVTDPTDTEMTDTEMTDTEMTDTEMTDTEMTDTDTSAIVCDNGVVLDGECVPKLIYEPIAELSIKPAPSSDASVTSLIYGTVAAFIVAGAIGGILALIYKARTRRKKQS